MLSNRPSARTASSLAMVFVILALAGCQHNVYELELKPAKAALDRKLTTWRTAGDAKPLAISASELQALAKEYGQPLNELTPGKHQFQRTFGARTPNDIGGSGYYLHWSSPLGDTFLYSEEFRGSGDLVAEFQRRQAGVDLLVNHLRDWLQAEYAKEPRFDEVAKLVDKEVRADLRNAAAWAWAYGVTTPDKSLPVETTVARIEMYLARQGYVQPADLPAWRRAIEDAQRDEPARLLALIQRIVATKLGHPTSDPPPPWLAWMIDQPRLKESFREHLARTPEYAGLLTQWEKNRASAPHARKPEPQDVVAELVLESVAADIHLVPDDELRVKLHAGTKPFATNGQWNDKSGEVSWNAELPSPTQSPRLLFAGWAEPNQAAQTKHFGKVVLEGQQLADYCLWYHGLAANELAAWDKFIAGLKADDEPVQKLRDLAFIDATGQVLPSSLIETPRRLLIPSR